MPFYEEMLVVERESLMQVEKIKALEERFGASDKYAVRKALQGCPVIQRVHDRQTELLDELLAKGELAVSGGGVVMCTQGEISDSVFFILSGEVSILCEDCEIARRQAPELVGEMSLLRETPERSATMKTSGPTALWKMSGRDFEVLANAHPLLWRGIGLRLSDRIRERDWMAPKENPVPRVFFGSSSERKEVLVPLEGALRTQGASLVANHWDKVFRPGDVVIDRLLELCGEVDFAVFVFAADDVLSARRSEAPVVRSNVLIEATMFMGSFGRERVFALVPPEAIPKLPSDLEGWTWVPMPEGEQGMAVAANRVASRMCELGVRPRFPRDKPPSLRKRPC